MAGYTKYECPSCEALRARVKELEERKASLLAENSRLDEVNASLANQLDATREDIAEVDAETESLEKAYDRQQKRIKELEEALRAADGYENGIIREFEEERDALRARVKELECCQAAEQQLKKGR
jgi:chromosome segregation ATPase